MLHPLVLVVVLSLVGYDGVGLLVEEAVVPRAIGAWSFLGGLILIAAAAHVSLMRFGRIVDQTGNPRAIRAADTTLALSRIGSALLFVVAVFLCDWIGFVRSAVGDWIGVDEALACAPPLLVYVAGWWSFYPIDRRMHEAVMLRALDSGRTVHAMPSRLGYTWEKARYSMLAAIVPLSLILLWGEASVMAAERWPLLPWPLTDERAVLSMAGVHLLGAIVVLVLSPPILLWLWDTSKLPPSELRSRLEAMGSRHDVKFQGIRIWHTRGLVLNGAVLGVLPRFRYVLLTDALIENLTEAQLDAVMAHEIGHVRRRHLPWLLATLATSLGLATWAAGAAISAASPSPDPMTIRAVDGGAFLFAVVTGLVIFGFVSRVFERQADAFAVQDGSGMTRANRGRSVVITPEAAESMAGALDAVARLNHIPQGKFTWRHGSIADRRRRILGLIGQRADRLAVDRQSRRVRGAVTAGLAALLIATLLETPDWVRSLESTESESRTAHHFDDSLHENARHRE